MVDRTRDEALLASWREEAAFELEGWDLSSLGDRYEADEEPWSYGRLARSALAGARSVLDMGTGGGEVLLSLRGALPEDIVATEGWPPNIPIAQRSLNPNGIEVVEYDAETDAGIPFPDERFDVVLNRHEAYAAGEVLRILRPGGTFLTQQVDGRDFEETQALFGGHTRHPDITLPNLHTEAERAGFEVVDAAEWAGRSRFTDVGALVHYLAMCPWQVPDDFAVDTYAHVLLELHNRGPAIGEPITFTMRRFYLLARKPGR
jgi:SAM-dependent methyltransferase